MLLDLPHHKSTGSQISSSVSNSTWQLSFSPVLVNKNVLSSLQDGHSSQHPVPLPVFLILYISMSLVVQPAAFTKHIWHVVSN